MVIWGAIWGLIIGFLWPGKDSDAQAVIGAVGGAVAGFSLRHIVRQEIEAQRASWLRAPGAVSEAAMVPAGAGKQGARVGQEPPTTRRNSRGDGLRHARPATSGRLGLLNLDPAVDRAFPHATRYGQ